MKKTISCFLILCACTLLSNAAFASTKHKVKTFVVEKSDVPKIQVVNNDVTEIYYLDYLETDNLLATSETKELTSKLTIKLVNVDVLAPDILRIMDRRVIHETIYILNLPKHYLLPNKNYRWHFGSNIRC